MQFSQRPISAIAAAAFACVVFASTSSQAQQPEPLRLSSPPAHALAHAEPAVQAQAQAQTQTAQGELLDVDAKANSLTVKTQSGEMSFRFNEQTKVTGAQKGVAGLATMTGAQVTVMFQKQGALNIASSIDVKEQK